MCHIFFPVGMYICSWRILYLPLISQMYGRRERHDISFHFPDGKISPPQSSFEPTLFGSPVRQEVKTTVDPWTHSHRRSFLKSLYKPIHKKPRFLRAALSGNNWGNSCNLAFEFSIARLDPSASHADFAEFQSRRLEWTLKHPPWKLESQPRGQTTERK